MYSRNKAKLSLGAAILFAAALCWFLLARNDWLTNVAFLVLGALVAVLTTILSEEVRRKTSVDDPAGALYVELADKVAKCCFDMEAPWQHYLDLKKCEGSGMDPLRLQKFSPGRPIIFEACASQIAILGTERAQALIQFYYRLSNLKRDIEAVMSESAIHAHAIRPKNLQMIALRFKQTIAPGLHALDAFKEMISDHEKIDATTLSNYDEYREDAPTGTLKERLKNIAKE
jgi:hypothetical protein